jgi:ABC transport system ATP-binding/permease protein
MLEVISLSSPTGPGDLGQTVLDSVHFIVPGGHLLALVGAPNSGKSAVLQVLSGAVRSQAGAIQWHGRDLVQHRLHPNELGLVGADDSLFERMSVKEHLVAALLLQVADLDRRDALIRTDRLMALCGLEASAGLRAEMLPLAQKRRLLLALALVGEPNLVLIDDFTRGLDPKSERELAALLKAVAGQNPHRVLINATQHLGNLTGYDSAIILHEGKVCFHGPGRAVTHYFSITHVDELYQRLAMRPAARWQDSWTRHRDSYYGAFKMFARGSDEGQEDNLGAASDDDSGAASKLRMAPTDEAGETIAPPAPLAQPSVSAQMAVLWRRAWTLVGRSKSSLWWRIGLTVAAPLVIAALAGADDGQASRVSGLILLQVLAVMGLAVVNAAGSFADERSQWLREHRSGLGIVGYAMPKIGYALIWAIAQGLVLVFAVDILTGTLPGLGGWRAALMLMTSIAFTFVCLGISACSRSAAQARSRAWCLAFFQAPSSGAIVGLVGLGTLLKPLSMGFQAWSGSVDTLQGNALFEGIKAINHSWFASPGDALIVLTIHGAIGLALIFWGLRRRR